MDVADAVGSRPVGEGGDLGRRSFSNRVTSSEAQSREKDNIKARLKTFVNWLGVVPAIQLSIVGFLYTGPGDRVECHSCKVSIGNWKKEDLPVEVHRKNSPDCTFMQKWFPSPKANSLFNGSLLKIEYDVSKAKYQDFVSFVRRLETFDAWPLKLDLHSPTNMSLAGFMYIGSADRARCFYCGLTLRDWDDDDDPFVAHLQWSSNCDYIKHVMEERVKKGSEPVDENQEPDGNVVTLPPRDDLGDCSDGGKMGKDFSTVTSSPSCHEGRRSIQVETVLTMGFSEDLIQAAITKRLETRGDEFPDAVSLFCAVEAISEKCSSK